MDKSLYHEFHEDERHENWWFKARRDIVLGLVKKLGITTEDRILDIGCGTGYTMEGFIVNGFGRVEGVDCSEDALGICREKWLGVKYGELPFLSSDQSFDLITCLDVVEHVDDDLAAVKNILQALKPFGRIIFTVPSFRFLWGHHDELNHHKRRYTKWEFELLVQKAWGNVHYLSYYNFFLFPLACLFKFINNAKQKLKNQPNPTVNSVLYYIFRLESRFINNNFTFPWGVSIIAVVSKR